MNDVKRIEVAHGGPRSTREQIEALGPWFHNLHLPDGVQTAPNHALGDFPRAKWAQVARYLPEDLRGWRALDVGCNAGFYSFELAKRGASVLGIDHDPHYLEQARWAAQKLGLLNQVELRQMDVYDLALLRETFDLVLFMGVFYHLRHPMLGLEIVTARVKKLFVFQTFTLPGEEVAAPVPDLGLDDRAVLNDPTWPRMAFIEHKLGGDPTNWWVPNHALVLALLRTQGMRLLARPGHEIYLCEPAGAPQNGAGD